MSGTLGGQRSDAALVAAAIAGDRHAFAGIYDRYSDRMHDFCWSLLRSPDEAADATQDTFVIAADRLHQLRDPEKLRPWLYAVARSVAMGQLRHRRRERAEADLEEIIDVTDGPHEVAHRGELRDLVWQAAQGLSERDRTIMDLHLRQGLEGRDLAMAMDVTENNANVMLSRVRDRVERSLGAFLVARLGSEHCEELQALLRNWDGRFTPLVRKRVARHVDECEACDARRRSVASPWALLGTVPMIPAPTALRDRVLGRIDLTSAGRARPRIRRFPTKVAAVAVAALVGTGGIVAGAEALRGRTANDPAPSVAAVAAGSEGTTTLRLDDATEAAAAGLRLSPDVLRLAAGDSGALTVRNLATAPVSWTATTTRPWLTLARTEGTIAPGALTRVGVAAGGAPEEGSTATVTVAYDGGTVTAVVEVSAATGEVTTAPEVTAPRGDDAGPDPVAPADDPSVSPARDPQRPSEPPAGGPDDTPTRDPQPPDSGPGDDPEPPEERETVPPRRTPEPQRVPQRTGDVLRPDRALPGTNDPPL